MLLLKQTIRRANKFHDCAGCGMSIEFDRLYVEASLHHAGKVSKHKMHADCLVLFVEWTEEAEFMSVPVSIKQPMLAQFVEYRDVNRKRGLYPHAVCSIERTLSMRY